MSWYNLHPRGAPHLFVNFIATQEFLHHTNRAMTKRYAMVKTEEVFMPYLILDKGQTLFERFQENGWQFQLEHKKK